MPKEHYSYVGTKKSINSKDLEAAIIQANKLGLEGKSVNKIQVNIGETIVISYLEVDQKPLIQGTEEAQQRP